MAQENTTQSKSSSNWEWGCGALGGVLFLVFFVIILNESKKPELPIRVKCYVNRETVAVGESIFGSITRTYELNVIDFINDSDRKLRVDIYIKNTGVRSSEGVYIIIDAHSVEHLTRFSLEGDWNFWYFESNEEMELSHPEYKTKQVQIKFEKGKSFTY